MVVTILNDGAVYTIFIPDTIEYVGVGLNWNCRLVIEGDPTVPSKQYDKDRGARAFPFCVNVIRNVYALLFGTNTFERSVIELIVFK